MHLFSTHLQLPCSIGVIVLDAFLDAGAVPSSTEIASGSGNTGKNDSSIGSLYGKI